MLTILNFFRILYTLISQNQLKIIYIVILFISLFFSSVKAQMLLEKGINLLTAVQITISENPTVHFYKKQIEFRKASFEKVSGKFDIQFNSFITQSRDNTPLLISQRTNGLSKITTDLTTYRISMDKRFRSGISGSFGIEMARISDQLSNITTSNYANVNFITKIPLLKGLGSKVAAVNEKAAKREINVSIMEFRHELSKKVFNTIHAYWKYVATKKILDICKKLELKAENFVQETHVLIAAGEMPSAEINQPLANLADKVTSRITSEQNLFEARQNLGLIMGLTSNEISNLPLPFDDFSIFKEKRFLDPHQINLFIKMAFQHRLDLSACEVQQGTRKILWNAAVYNRKYQLDLNLELGYSGLDEGKSTNRYFTPFNKNISGLNMMATLSLTLPTNTSYGLMNESHVMYQQSIIQTNDLRRNICSSVTVALEDYKQCILRLKKSQEAIQLYMVAVENEKKKLQQGMATIIDLIFIEERLTNALINDVACELNYANSIARIRFETSTLLNFDQDEISLNMKDLIKIPFVGE